MALPSRKDLLERIRSKQRPKSKSFNLYLRERPSEWINFCFLTGLVEQEKFFEREGVLRKTSSFICFVLARGIREPLLFSINKKGLDEILSLYAAVDEDITKAEWAVQCKMTDFYPSLTYKKVFDTSDSYYKLREFLGVDLAEQFISEAQTKLANVSKRIIFRGDKASPIKDGEPSPEFMPWNRRPDTPSVPDATTTDPELMRLLGSNGTFTPQSDEKPIISNKTEDQKPGNRKIKLYE